MKRWLRELTQILERLFTTIEQDLTKSSRFRFNVMIGDSLISGDQMSLLVNFETPFSAPTPIDGFVTAADSNGNPTGGVIGTLTLTSSDSTVFTVEPDPNTAEGFILTQVAVGSATLTVEGDVTDPSGVVTDVTSVLDVTIDEPVTPESSQFLFTITSPTNVSPDPSGSGAAASSVKVAPKVSPIKAAVPAPLGHDPNTAAGRAALAIARAKAQAAERAKLVKK